MEDIDYAVLFPGHKLRTVIQCALENSIERPLLCGFIQMKRRCILCLYNVTVSQEKNVTFYRRSGLNVVLNLGHRQHNN